MKREILRIAVPSIVSNVTVPLLSLVDVGIAGHLGSPVYIGAIAVGSMIFNMVYWLLGFLRMGTSGLTAQALGAGRRAEQVRTLRRSLTLGALIGLLLILLQWPLGEAAFWFYSATPAVEQSARSYFHVLIWGAPAVLSLGSLNGWLLGMQDARSPMIVAISQNVLNIALSLFFVAVAGMRVEGVALGTLIAQWFGLMLALVLTRRLWKRHVCSTRLQRLSLFVPTLRIPRRFLLVNRDIFLRTLFLVSVMTFFTREGARQGELVLAVNAVLLEFYLLVSYVMDGFAFAGEAIGGRLSGARDHGGFRRLVQTLLGLGLLLSALFTLFYLLAGPWLVALLTDEPRVHALAGHFLPYVVLMPLLSFLAFLLDGVYIGLTATRSMLWSVGSSAVLFFLLFFSLKSPLGAHSLWVAYDAFLLLRGLVLLLLLASATGRAFPPISGKPPL